ncbi:N-terminal double-transmembrane domain-containing protein [Lutibacter oricola]|uniref:N-terminal double-transmembrane domain-containing protein n=1 Tax=Lutibacter oricola TaxID=762486 RepID=A0A1H2W7K4_9FLAO|nr:BatA domain-containing protein [Lutibacter oricola]SDW76632.1 N-terminal double-transmembrane domain-containing protein [Lutibacter oricola]
MQFNNPEILYAFLLLIIPIIVHLFQLQKFVKVPFTNVKFLKKIELKTRKSSRIKKWLILATRLLALSCLILAFSQPYFSNIEASQKVHTTIYLDNSLSMQAKSEKGELLKNATQTIIENLDSKNSNFSLITDNSIFKNIDVPTLKNELINLKYSSNSINLNTATLKLNSTNNNQTNTLHKKILISDFHTNKKNINQEVTNVNSSFLAVNLKPIQKNNFYIDSVFIANKNSSEISLEVLIKSNQIITQNLPVSLFSEEKLLGKTSSKFLESNVSKVQFTIKRGVNLNGKLSINDESLAFDNDFYFTISSPEKINVLSIGKTAEFLKKIYSKNEFNFTQHSLQNLNYRNLNKQHLIILNELDKIPNELALKINDFYKNGGSVVLIPSENIELNLYNSFLQKLTIGSIKKKMNTSHLISDINFNHPIFKNVFEKQIKNFEYPKTDLHYPSFFSKSLPIVKFDNTKNFISSNNNNGMFYWVASPLSTSTTNFTQTPLIVPIFYNIGKNSININQLYYTLNKNNKIDIQTTLDKNAVLKISNKLQSFIPLQQNTTNKTTLTIEDQISKSGFYNIQNNNTTIKNIAFNYNRNESIQNYMDIENLEKTNSNITFYNSIDAVLKKIDTDYKINWLFKWFLAFSALFLLIEMLILKYFKI